MFDKTMVRGSLAVALVATMFGATVHGSLIAYDSFAYPAGSSLAGQNGGGGFSDAWYEGGYNVSEALTTVASGSLTYPLLATAGNALTTPATSYLNGIERDLANPLSSGTFYLSCLLCPQGTLGQGNGNGFFGLYLHGSQNDLFMGGGDSQPYNIGLRGGTDVSLSNSPEVLGQSELLVLKCQLYTSGNDVFTLYPDPTPGAAQPSTGTVINNITIGTLNSLVIYSGGAFTMGDLRVGTTYADVTPSVSTWAAAVSGSWSQATNWSPAVPNAAGAGAVIDAPTTVPLTVTVDTPQTLGTLVLGNSAAAGVGYALSGAGSNTLTLNNSGMGATITVMNGTHAIEAPLILNDNLTVTGVGSLTIGGNIVNGSNGPMGITASGGGLLVLASSNIYSGSTTIGGGTVSLAHPLAVQNSTVNLAGGALTFAAGITSPTLGGLAGSGNIALTTVAAEPVMLNVGGNAQNTSYAGVLSGAGGLTKQGGGGLALTAPSTYQGPTVIAGGVLQLDSTASAAGGDIGIHFIGTGSALTGTGGVVPMGNWNNESGFSFSGTTLAAGNGANSGATFSLNGAAGVWGTGSTNQLLNGYVFANNYNSMTLTIGNIPYARYSVYVYVGDSGVGYQEKATINGTAYYYATEGSTLASYAQITSTNPANHQSGNYIEVDGLTSSSQTVSIAGDSQQYGGLCSVEIVNTAPVVGSNINILPATTALSIASGGTLDLSGGSQQVASLSDNTPGSGGSVINSSSAVSVLTLSPTGGSTTFSGMIQGGGTLGTISLVINGSGTQVLAGSNSYTGPTTISQGKLVVDGWLTNSAVSVNGGTLGGTGHLSSVTVSAGGQLAPGDPLGTLHVSGNLILESGAVLDYELDTPSTSDEISCGSLALTNQQFSDFHFTWSANFGPGIYDLIAFGSSSGSLASTSGTIDGLPANLAVHGNDLVLTVVPEPSTLALLGAGVLGLIGWAAARRSRTVKPCLALACFFSAGGFAQAGDFFVSNYYGNTIEQYSSTGADLGVFAYTGLSEPQGLVLDGNGNLYVANWSSNTIEKFSSTGKDLGVFASSGLDEPCELAFDHSGNLYVANWGNNTIDKFSSTGTSLAVITSWGLDHPAGIAFDSSGNMYASNWGNSTVEKFSSTGLDLGVFASSNLNHPAGLAFDSRGDLYVANYWGTTIEEFSPSGTDLGAFASNLSGPDGLSFDSSGNLYVVNQNTDTIVKFAANGSGSVFASSGMNEPDFIAVQTPEPTSIALLLAGAIALVLHFLRAAYKTAG